MLHNCDSDCTLQASCKHQEADAVTGFLQMCLALTGQASIRRLGPSTASRPCSHKGRKIQIGRAIRNVLV